MTPSWYDVLDVDPDAGTEEIRGAWKSAIGDLEPGNRRFRALNDAAEVLLDPTRRAAHDADLARDAAETERASEDAPDDEQDVAPGTAPGPPPYAASPYAPSTRWAPPGWLLAGVCVLVAALVGLCVWQLTIPSDASVRASTRSAQATAERAAVAVLSYDYQDLDASESVASSFLTTDYRRTDYEPLFALIRENAPSTKTVVTAEVVASGVVRSGDDRVSVLIFVNRPTLRADRTEPEVFRDQVTMEMERVGDEWLVDDLVTNALDE